MNRSARWSWAFMRRSEGGWSRNRFFIGSPDNPMMARWRLVQTPWFGVYLHFIYREDLDPVPHDHPWRFRTFVLSGGYSEQYSPDARTAATNEFRRHQRWSSHRFPLRAAHRIVSVQPRTVTLVAVGPKVRTWGFYQQMYVDSNQTAFIDWRDALGVRPTEGVVSTGKWAVPVSVSDSGKDQR